MPSQITVTSTAGPGLTVTGLVLTPIKEIHTYFAPASMLQVVMSDGRVREFSLAATTTYTVTIAAGVGTVVISQ